MDTVLLLSQTLAKPLMPFLVMSEDDEDSGGSIADKGVGSPRKKDDNPEKEVDPEEIFDETDGTGFPMAKEKGDTDPDEEKKMEETL